jgi:hypothetical protein
MKTFLTVLFVLSFVLISCESGDSEVDPISKEHAALFGTWNESKGDENTIWVFERYEVKWKGFKHFYTVSGDSVLISGMAYQIVEQSEKEMTLMNPVGKKCRLVRQK